MCKYRLPRSACAAFKSSGVISCSLARSWATVDTTLLKTQCPLQSSRMRELHHWSVNADCPFSHIYLRYSGQLELSLKMRKRNFPCAPNEGSNQPAHPRSLISLRCFLWPHASLAIQTSPSEDSDQTLNLRWAHMSEGTFSYVSTLLPYFKIVYCTFCKYWRATKAVDCNMAIKLLYILVW